MSKFVNRFFPPSKTTNLRNEITRFQQRFGETFAETWDRFKDLLNKCPHHGFSPLHQIDTFYNSLNQSEHDSLNSAAGGNFLTKNTQEALTIIENKSKQVEALLSLHRPVNSVQNGVNYLQNGCETCGGQHAYYECQAAGGYTQEDVYATTGTYNTGGNSYQPQAFNERPQGVLLSNTIPNPQEDIKVITTWSGITLAGPSVPPPNPSSFSKKILERNPHQPSIPYPSRLNKEKLQDKSDIQIHKFLQMFKKLHFNISFA
ncbi:reverse transcriptase domain-containing protein [Tanacetum coccineum]